MQRQKPCENRKKFVSFAIPLCLLCCFVGFYWHSSNYSKFDSDTWKRSEDSNERRKMVRDLWSVPPIVDKKFSTMHP